MLSGSESLYWIERRRAIEEIDRLRGWQIQARIVIDTKQSVINFMERADNRKSAEIVQLKAALGELTETSAKRGQEIKRLKKRMEHERAGRDSEVAQRVMKAGLKAGRKEAYDELVDRKGEPLPTAREIMDKAVADGMAHLHQRARERQVNYDGSRVDRPHLPHTRPLAADGTPLRMDGTDGAWAGD